MMARRGSLSPSGPHRGEGAGRNRGSVVPSILTDRCFVGWERRFPMMTQITSAQAAILAINSLALGGLLFLLSAGFSLIFGLMRIPNLMHGSFFMLGAYFGVSMLDKNRVSFWLAALISGAAMAVIGAIIERFLLRRLAGQELAQVLLTLGLSFIVADLC